MQGWRREKTQFHPTGLCKDPNDDCAYGRQLPKRRNRSRAWQPILGRRLAWVEIEMGMRIPSGSPAMATSQSSAAQWQQRTQQAQIKAVVASAPPPAPPPPANTGQYINLVA
jgi:hypothetical protein